VCHVLGPFEDIDRGADLDAWIRSLTDLVKREEPALAGFAWRCLAVRMRRPQREDVEDVLSDAYLAAATRLRCDSSLVVHSLGAWFRRVLFFRCLKHAKMQSADDWEKPIDQLEREDEMVEILHRGSHIETEDAILADELLSTLGGRDRRILELTIEGYTSREIAEVLEETPENVRKVKSRAIGKLQRIHEGHHE